jgi:hypothetical protein
MGTPHQGTDVADKKLAKLGSNLIEVSLEAQAGGEVTVTDAMTEFGRSYLANPQNSVDNLQSHSIVCETIAEMPFAEGLKIHSIIGKTGSGPLQDSTDKMVPYWSSHLDEAVSEKVVPCKHGDLTTHPDAIQELRRILLLHLSEGSDLPL